MRIFLIVAQIVVSCLLAGLILLQANGTGLGNSALFGGSGEFYSSKRGVERAVFAGTIVLTALFATLSFLLLILK